MTSSILFIGGLNDGRWHTVNVTMGIITMPEPYKESPMYPCTRQEVAERLCLEECRVETYVIEQFRTYGTTIYFAREQSLTTQDTVAKLFKNYKPEEVFEGCGEIL